MRLADGRQLDQYTITDDFVHLSHNSGVYLYEDLLAVLAVRRGWPSLHLPVDAEGCEGLLLMELSSSQPP